MRLLEDIPTFPSKIREILSSQFGIDTAEAFFANAVNNPAGIALALERSRVELDKLIELTEGYIAPEFVDRCRRPEKKHPRGLKIKTD